MPPDPPNLQYYDIFSKLHLFSEKNIHTPYSTMVISSTRCRAPANLSMMKST